MNPTINPVTTAPRTKPPIENPTILPTSPSVRLRKEAE